MCVCRMGPAPACVFICTEHKQTLSGNCEQSLSMCEFIQVFLSLVLTFDRPLRGWTTGAGGGRVVVAGMGQERTVL